MSRIKELMPKAYELVRKRHNGYFDQDLLLQYMAELVIKECIAVLDEDDGATHHSQCLKGLLNG